MLSLLSLTAAFFFLSFQDVLSLSKGNTDAPFVPGHLSDIYSLYKFKRKLLCSMLTIALVYGHKHSSLVVWVGSSRRFITQRALVSPLEPPVSPVINFLPIIDMNSLMWRGHQIQSEVNCSSL